MFKCVITQKGAFFMKSNWKKTVAGIVAIATLIPACFSSVYAASPSDTTDGTSIVMDAPTYEEPMPEDEVAAQIASDLESTAPSIDLPVAGTEETVVGEEDIYTSDDGLFQYKLVGEKVHIVSWADELEDVVIPETIDDVEVN